MSILGFIRGRMQVTFKNKEQNTSQSGTIVTHEWWTAPSKAAAMAYLNHRRVSKDDYYVDVETPEGTWQKGKHCGISRY